MFEGKEKKQVINNVVTTAHVPCCAVQTEGLLWVPTISKPESFAGHWDDSQKTDPDLHHRCGRWNNHIVVGVISQHLPTYGGFGSPLGPIGPIGPLTLFHARPRKMPCRIPMKSHVYINLPLVPVISILNISILNIISNQPIFYQKAKVTDYRIIAY